MKIYCFTGYRPQKLYGFDWKTKGNQFLLLQLRDLITNIIQSSNDNEIKFICGASLGIDQMTFEVIYKLKNFFPNKKIVLELAIPFKKYESFWINKKDLDRYYLQIEKANIVTYVDEIVDYQFETKNLNDKIIATIKNDKRNQYMVNNSDEVISIFNLDTLYNDEKSGTKNCVKYSILKNKKIINLNPYSFKVSYLKNKVILKEKNIQTSLF